VNCELIITADISPEDLTTSPERFINREFSWLQFNRRVLEETLNATHPLLERIRFLSISAANLDEFFMVRVAGLEGQVREGITNRSPDGLSPANSSTRFLRKSTVCSSSSRLRLPFCSSILPTENIYIVSPFGLVEGDMAWLEDEFLQSIFPVLTPLSIDPAHPFPFIPNLGFSICLQLASKAANEPMTALIRLAGGA
jgi:polyphosphate kinase